MFELRAVPHTQKPNVTFFEVWEGNFLRGVIYPTETGIKVLSKFLLPDPHNRVHTELQAESSFVTVNLHCQPYFTGQTPAPCGHYYPDAIRVQDISHGNGKYERHYYCDICGDYRAPIGKEAYSPKKPKQAKLTEMMTEGWRMSERARIHKERHE